MEEPVQAEDQDPASEQPAQAESQDLAMEEPAQAESQDLAMEEPAQSADCPSETGAVCGDGESAVAEQPGWISRDHWQQACEVHQISKKVSKALGHLASIEKTNYFQENRQPDKKTKTLISTTCHNKGFHMAFHDKMLSKLEDDFDIIFKFTLKNYWL